MDVEAKNLCGDPPLRRSPKPDEWSEDYLLTLVRLHGLGKPGPKDLDLVRGLLNSSPPGESIDSVVNRSGGWRGDFGRPQYGPLPLPRWASVLRAVPIRYCPICYAQDSYVRGRWRMPSLLVCTLHGCYLKLGMKDCVLTTLRKGDQLPSRELISNEALLAGSLCCLPQERAIASAIWGPFETAAQASAMPATDAALGEMAAWALLAWRLVERVASEHVRVVQRAQIPGPLPSMARLFVEFGLSISPDRAGVCRFLSGLRHNVHFVAAQRVLRGLMAAERGRPTSMGQLPLAELEELCVAMAPRPGGRARPGEVAFPEELAVGMSRHQAMETLGVSEQLVTQWMHIGWLPRVQTRIIGRKRLHFINKQDVQQLRRRLASLLYVADLLSDHKIDLPTFYGLQAAGLLHPVCVAERRYVTRQQLSALISQLELVSTPKPADLLVDLPLFGQPTRGLCRMMDTYASLVRTALAGRFPVYRDLDATGLAAFRLGQEGLAWVQNENRRAKASARQCSLLDAGQLELLEA